jgi:fluoride ion exporter CrcB/FEX
MFWPLRRTSFTLDTVTLLNLGAYGVATVYILMSVIVGILATMLGLNLVRIFW